MPAAGFERTVFAERSRTASHLTGMLGALYLPLLTR